MSFGKNEFDLVIGFRIRTRNILRLMNLSRLRRLYFEIQTNKKQWEREEEFVAIKFRSDEDAVNVTLAFFIDYIMMGREKKQEFDQKLLRLVDD